MSNNNFRISKENIFFSKLENAQNVKKIAKIFAKDKPNYELKPNPHLVIVVGAPGVGKTTKTQQIIKKELGLNYDDFYNISLDSLVEKVKPYRNTTKRLYNTIKAKKVSLGSPELNDTNFGILSDMYLPTIMSRQSNFSIEKSMAARMAKIEALGNEAALEDLKKRKAVAKETETELKHLNDLRREGLIYGVMNGLNIIYDTTLQKTKDIIKLNIMPVLEMNREVKYKITVILVTAEVKNIQNRIRGRHNKMLAENSPYIRAINPKLTEMFVKENKYGFDNSLKYFKSNDYQKENPLTFYKSTDFDFIEVENPSIRNTTRKNNNNRNNNFKYF
jgi:GTPase SAR1 family protein